MSRLTQVSQVFYLDHSGLGIQTLITKFDSQGKDPLRMANILPPRKPDDKANRFIGLDLAKNETQLSLLNADGKEIHTRRFISSRETFLKLASELGPLDSVALEVTTNSFSIARILMTSGAAIVISDPVRTRIIAESKFKTDKIDARKLAELLRVDYLPKVWLPDMETEQLRHLMSDRQSLVDRRTELKNRVHTLLHRNLAKISASDIFGPSGRVMLDAIGATPIQKTVDPASDPKISDPKTSDLKTSGLKTSSLKPAGVKSSSRVGARKAVAADLPAFNKYDLFSLKSALSDIDQLEQRVGELDSLLASFISGVPWMLENLDILLSVTGVGLVVGAGLIAAIGDVTRFNHPKKLACYFGLVPSTFQSGDSPAYHGRITKRGRAQARWLAVEAAEHLRKSPGPLRAFYTRIAKKRNRNIAIVALARKLAELSWHLLTKKQDFMYAIPRLTDEKRAHARFLANGWNAAELGLPAQKGKGGAKTQSPLYGTGLSGRIVKTQIVRRAASQTESQYKQIVEARERNIRHPGNTQNEKREGLSNSFGENITGNIGDRTTQKTHQKTRRQPPRVPEFNPLKPNQLDWQKVLQNAAAQILKDGNGIKELQEPRKQKESKKAHTTVASAT
jgi:transposase